MSFLPIIMLLVFIIYASNHVTISTMSEKLKPEAIKKIRTFNDVSGQGMALIAFASLFYKTSTASDVQFIVYTATYVLVTLTFAFYYVFAALAIYNYKETKKKNESGNTDPLSVSINNAVIEDDSIFIKNTYLMIGISFASSIMLPHILMTYITG